MYEQIEKPKENKSRAVANSVTQKKSNKKQGFGFVDNRFEVRVKREGQDTANIGNSEVRERMNREHNEPNIHTLTPIIQLKSRLSNLDRFYINTARARRRELFHQLENIDMRIEYPREQECQTAIRELLYFNVKLGRIKKTLSLEDHMAETEVGYYEEDRRFVKQERKKVDDVLLMYFYILKTHQLGFFRYLEQLNANPQLLTTADQDSAWEKHNGRDVSRGIEQHEAVWNNIRPRAIHNYIDFL